MTNIIRLNEAINDYVSRPVITQLGEALIALNASTHIAELGSKSDILPSDILIDGSYGQSTPNPFITKIGAGTATVKSDSNGSYVSFNNCGFRANESATIFNYDKSKSVLLVAKFRVATLAAVTTEAPISRIFSLNNIGPLITLSVGLINTKKHLTVNSGASEVSLGEAVAGKVYTMAVLRTPTQCKVITAETIQNTGSVGSLNPKVTSEDIRAMGLNVKSVVIDDSVPLSSTDVFSYEFYGNGNWSDAQIQNYLATL
ncbi:hypothetical protein [Acinetobacter johnsonii]|uniref:hypothetical protein n=1 Tax=Acinetobacter johnsonii TaxID=40214 RepID=UPI003F551587